MGLKDKKKQFSCIKLVPFNPVTWSTLYFSISIIIIIGWQERFNEGGPVIDAEKQEQMKSIKINWMWQLCVGDSSQTYGMCPQVTILIIVTARHTVYNLAHCCLPLMWKWLSKQQMMTTKLDWRFLKTFFRWQYSWKCCIWLCFLGD